jgi:hypothetical protein
MILQSTYADEVTVINVHQKFKDADPECLITFILEDEERYRVSKRFFDVYSEPAACFAALVEVVKQAQVALLSRNISRTRDVSLCSTFSLPLLKGNIWLQYDEYGTLKHLEVCVADWEFQSVKMLK